LQIPQAGKDTLPAQGKTNEIFLSVFSLFPFDSFEKTIPFRKRKDIHPAFPVANDTK
jgi:hypothetical protein